MNPRLTLLLIASLLSYGQTPIYRVAGRVVNSVTGAPIGKTRMTLTNRDNRAKSSSLVTLADGLFSFDVPEGRYNLSAERHGQSPQLYGQRSLASIFSTSIITGPEQHTDRLTFRMIPNSTLSGRIVDESGDPVEHAMVQLYRSNISSSGRRQVRRLSYAYSDDLGAYRFSPLAAGDYYVAVSAQPWYTNPERSGFGDQPGNVPRMAYPLTFFPSTRDPQNAAPIRIQAGEDAAADLTLTATPGYAVTVKCDAGIQSPRVTLVGGNLLGTDTFVRIETVYCPQFPLGIVAPGSYLLRSWRGSGSNSNPLVARQKFDVSSDIEVKMDFRPAPTVYGEVQIADLKGQEIVVTLRAEQDGVTVSRAAGPDGKFAFPEVVPGIYRVSLREPSGAWVKQVLVDGKPPAGGTFEIAEDHAPHLTIIPARGLAHLTGKVMKDGNPVAAALVVLVPKTPSTDSADYGVDKTDSDGTFEMPYVRPGDYFLVATGVDELEYANPAVIEPYLRHAVPLHIEPARDYKEEINAQPPPG